MQESRWTLSNGVELPKPEVSIYLPTAFLSEDQLPSLDIRREQPLTKLATRALNTYRWARNNAVALIEEARILSAKGRHARAVALACTALEKIGKSQYAADVYTAFVAHESFEKAIRQHQFKSWADEE